MFYIRFLGAELRRRPGRTALTALGLAVGVGLVVIVGALSAGLDDAQEEALAPLTGVGTDVRVSRPLSLPEGGGSAPPAFSSLSENEQRLLRKENPEGLFHFEPGELGEPGEAFTKVQTLSSELSFPVSMVGRVLALDGARGAAAALSLQTLRIEGKVPAPGTVVNPHTSYDIVSLNVTGVDVEQPSLAPVTPGQVTEGEYFSRAPQDARDEAIIDMGYARQNGIAVGDTTNVAGKRFDVVGLSAAPLGGTASNVYLELGRLQQLSDRTGRANVMLVRAESTASVEPLSRAIGGQLPGAVVTTASELADRVGGSLVDAKNLSSKLGTALAIVALGAAFLIATLLALASVQKRTRELGTLKALGWRRRLVVRQVSAESVVQGLLGGIAGAALGDRRRRRHRRPWAAAGGIGGTGSVASGGIRSGRRGECRQYRGPARGSGRRRSPDPRRLPSRLRRAGGRRCGRAESCPAPSRRGPEERRVNDPRESPVIQATTGVPASYELEAVSRTYGEGRTVVTALDSLDLTIRSGESVAILGPSGSGKTTLLQLLGALDRPSAGTVRFEGHAVEHLGEAQLADLRLAAIGFVFQQFNLIPTLTAAENVEAGLAPLRMKGVDRRRVAAEHLKAVGLEPRAGHLPSQLYGGEQQRVAIARALARSPRVVLADEPTGNLDTRSGELVIDLLGALHRELEITLILVTHDQWVAERADRVLKLDDGRLIGDETADSARVSAR